MRALLVARVALVALLTLSSGCHCRKKSDEVLLREKIDTSYVHLYLASKIAITEKSAEATKARAAIVKLMGVTGGSGFKDLSAADASALALALWDMRGVGKDALARNRKDYPDPILPVLVPDQTEDFAKLVDANTEHGILLIAFTLLKAHPDSPVPVPPEILLYESWALEPDRMNLASLGPAMHGVKAYTYAASDLCDLAAAEAEKVPDEGSVVDPKALAEDLKELLDQDVQLGEKGSDDLDAAIRSLSNGALALCYLKRDDLDKATPPLRRFLDGARKLGMKGKEMDALRAYVDCGGGEKCAHEISRPTLALLVAKVAYEQLAQSGMLDALEKAPAVVAIHRYTLVMADALGSARDVIPSFDSVAEKAKSWWPPW